MLPPPNTQVFFLRAGTKLGAQLPPQSPSLDTGDRAFCCDFADHAGQPVIKAPWDSFNFPSTEGVHPVLAGSAPSPLCTGSHMGCGMQDAGYGVWGTGRGMQDALPLTAQPEEGQSSTLQNAFPTETALWTATTRSMKAAPTFSPGLGPCSAKIDWAKTCGN